MRKKGLYPRLALVNLLKDSAFTFPYLLTCIGAVMMYYTITTIAEHPAILQMRGATALYAMMQFGSVVSAILCTVFLLYTNGFLIRRRKKELGLYGVLGMEKRHIGYVLLFETLFAFAVCVTLGILGGMVFGNLMFLLLLNITSLPTTLTFALSTSALIKTVTLFGVIFLAVLLINLFRVSLNNPIALMRGGKVGERPPKASWLITLIGLAALGSGYYIAVTAGSPAEALVKFFLAVILVIIGTYALFMSGSIALLKALKRNKSFYYRPTHFISVSGMIYRMKQNAAGLASICILSTMVLVTVSSTVSLYLGSEDALTQRSPKDLSVFCDSTEQNRSALSAIAADTAHQHPQVQLTGTYTYEYVQFSIIQQGREFLTDEALWELNNVRDMILLTLEDYNRMAGEQMSLGPNQVLLFSTGGDYAHTDMRLGGMELAVSRELQTFPVNGKWDVVTRETYYVVLPDRATLEQAYQAANGKPVAGVKYAMALDLAGTHEDLEAFSRTFRELASHRMRDFSYNSRELNRADFYTSNGGFLFLGIFFGSLFLMATVLIIYYKQISEGSEDRARFAILQDVGMDQRMVKKTIRSQVLTVFFLPLISAMVHMAFAFGMIPKALALFGMSNVHLALLSALGTALAFGLIYWLVYSLTARTYYRMVRTAR